MTENANVVSDVVAPLAGAAGVATVLPSAAEYDADSITVLEGLEAVRKRPGMYIGDTSDGSGLHHMIYEVIDNGIDEALGGYCDLVTLTINEDGSATITDNGRGIPVDMHKKQNKPAIEVIMTILHAGGKFDQNSYKVSGGLHGVGVSVVNALSSRLEVTVRRDGHEHFIAFAHGDVVEPLRTIGTYEGRSGTKVTFWPSEQTFAFVDFNAETLMRRMRELAFLNSGVKIVFQDLREGKNNDPVAYFYEGGIAEMVRYIDRNEDVINSRPIICRGVRLGKQNESTVDIGIDIAFQWNGGYQEKLSAFTNNIPQKDGGTHVQGFRTSLTRVLTAFAEKNATAKNKHPITADDIREGMTAVVSVKVPDPKFSSQTKEKLVSSEVAGAVQVLVNEVLPVWLDENPAEAKKILAKITQAAAVRVAMRAARERERKADKLEISSIPDKLADCQTKNPAEAEVFIVEGDSAGGSAKQGRNRYNQAILPLRGKVLNVERAPMDKVVQSEQIGTLITALGTGYGDDDFDPDKVRYHKIIIMTDADVDGNHIRTLLLTFFFRKMLRLIDLGYIYVAQPPLYKITKGKNKIYLLNEKERDLYITSSGINGATLTLADGTVKEGEELVEMVLAARDSASKITALAEDIGSEDVAAAMAVAGFFGPEAFASKSNRAALVEYLCELLTSRTERTLWSGEATDEGIDLTWRHRGVVSSCSVPSTIVKKQDAIALTKQAEILGSVFGAGATLANKGNEIKIMSPRGLFDAADEAGRKGITMIQRYKGLGEMSWDELKETTLDPENRSLRQVRLRDINEAGDIFSVLMGKDVGERRQYIIDHSKLAEVDL